MLTLSGILKTPAGQPLANVEIRFYALMTGSNTLKSTTGSINTDSAGKYTVTLPVGQHRVTVRQGNTRPEIIGVVQVTENTVATSLNELLIAGSTGTFNPITDTIIAAIGSAIAAANTATEQAGIATAKASAASSSASAAKASASTATTKAGEASSSASAASQSQAAAATNESLSKEWADKAVDTAITGNAGKYSAKHHATKANNSATLAGQHKASAENAVTAATEQAGIASTKAAEAAASAATFPAAILDSARRAVERASGGKRTLIYDTFGNANTMNVFHKTTYENLKLTASYGTGVLQAFKKDAGADFSEIFLATFQSSGNQYVSEARQIPKYSVNFDQVVAGHKAKGVGWGTLSMFDRALVIHIMESLGWQPRGNTAHGMAHDAPHEWGQRQDDLLAGDSSGTGNILTGTGPDTWNHDGTPHGMADIVGNLWEWLYGMKMIDGRFHLDLYNNQGAESSWVAQNAYIDGPGTPQLANAKTAGTTSSTPWASLGKKAGYVSSELMKRALIEPAGQALALNGQFYQNNTGERLPIAFGTRDYAGAAGPSALHVSYARTAANSSIASRARFAV